ncbi:MAG: YabP/YqfC family sporulation protein, partial [Emergencia sp.]
IISYTENGQPGRSARLFLRGAGETAPVFPRINLQVRSYTYTMKLINEFTYDFDITGPKITASGRAAVIENVRQVLLISDSSVTVDTGRFFVTVSGSGFVISEIWEGRMELEGNITGIEFYKTLGKGQAAGL